MRLLVMVKASDLEVGDRLASLIQLDETVLTGGVPIDSLLDVEKENRSYLLVGVVNPADEIDYINLEPDMQVGVWRNH